LPGGARRAGEGGARAEGGGGGHGFSPGPTRKGCRGVRCERALGLCADPGAYLRIK